MLYDLYNSLPQDFQCTRGDRHILKEVKDFVIKKTFNPEIELSLDKLKIRHFSLLKTNFARDLSLEISFSAIESSIKELQGLLCQSLLLSHYG